MGLTALFAVRFAISKGRILSSGFESATDNRPMFLFYDGVVLDENLALARVTQAELMSKLREANAWTLKKSVLLCWNRPAISVFCTVKMLARNFLKAFHGGAPKIVDRKFGLSFLKGGVLNLAPSRSSCVSGFDR